MSHAGASLVVQLVRIRLQCRRPRFNSRVGKIPWNRDRLPTPVLLGFPGGPDVKNLPAVWRPRLDPWLGKIPWSRDRLPTPVFSGFPAGSAGKESICNARGLGSYFWQNFNLPHHVLNSCLIILHIQKQYRPTGLKGSGGEGILSILQIIQHEI